MTAGGNDGGGNDLPGGLDADDLVSVVLDLNPGTNVGGIGNSGEVTRN